MMNNMCKNCARLGIDCKCTERQTWSGCVYKENTQQTLKRMLAMVKYKNFIISEDGGKIRIQNTQTGTGKSVKVTTDKYCDFIFKCLKTQIKTRYTAHELLDWMQSLIDKDFGTAYISTICDKYAA